MKLYQCLILAGVFQLLTYCTQNEEKVVQLHKNLMMLHDEEMAQMDQIYRLKTLLQSVDTTKVNTQELLQLIRSLEKADESMMIWMRNYKEPVVSESHEKKEEYYLQEINKLQNTKSLMQSSMDSATKYLKNYGMEVK